MVNNLRNHSYAIFLGLIFSAWNIRNLSFGETVVFFNTHHKGHLAPTLGLAKLFVLNGIEVVFYAPYSVKLKQQLINIGASYKHYLNDTEWQIKQFAVNVTENLLRQPTDPLLRGGLLFVQVLPTTVGLMDFVLSELQRIRPMLVIYDSASAWGKLGARALDIPAVSSCSSALIGLEEKESVFGFLRNQQYTIEAANLLMSRYGIQYDAIDSYANYEDDPGGITIVWSLPILQPPPPHSSFVRYFGASLLSDIGDSNSFDSLLSVINEILSKGRKLVYVSLGTVVGQEAWSLNIIPFFKNVIQAFQEHPEYFVVLAVGERTPISILNEGTQPFPSNFVIQQVVPQKQLVKLSYIFISHVGNNGFNEALYFGTPILAVPIFGDQNINAATVERLGLGVAIFSPFAPSPAENIDHITASVLMDAVDALVSKYATVKQNLNEISEEFLLKEKYFSQLAVSDLVQYAKVRATALSSGIVTIGTEIHNEL